jgi:hypothetical protein
MWRRDLPEWVTAVLKPRQINLHLNVDRLPKVLGHPCVSTMDAGDVTHGVEPISEEHHQQPGPHPNELFTHPAQGEKLAEESMGVSTSQAMPTDNMDETPTLNTILSSRDEPIATTNSLAEDIAHRFEATKAPQATASSPSHDAVMLETSPPPAPIYGDFGMEVDSAVSATPLE